MLTGQKAEDYERLTDYLCMAVTGYNYSRIYLEYGENIFNSPDLEPYKHYTLVELDKFHVYNNDPKLTPAVSVEMKRILEEILDELLSDGFEWSEEDEDYRALVDEGVVIASGNATGWFINLNEILEALYYDQLVKN